VTTRTILRPYDVGVQEVADRRMPEDHATRGLADCKAAETLPRVVKPSPDRLMSRDGNWGGTEPFQ
jgi:hypothetical protein